MAEGPAASGGPGTGFTTSIDLPCEAGSTFQVTVQVPDGASLTTVVACQTGGFVVPEPQPGMAVTVHL